MPTESAIFTVLPNGVDKAGAFLRLTIFVSPRLLTDGAGELPLSGSGFDAFEMWPKALQQLKLSIAVDGGGQFNATPDPDAPAGADPETWALLFEACAVKDGKFKDLSKHRFRSFPVVATAKAVLDLYSEVAEGSPTVPPPVTAGVLDALSSEIGDLAVNGKKGEATFGAYRSLDLLMGNLDPQGTTGRFLDRSKIPPGQRRRMAFTEAYRFYDRPGSRDPLGPDDVPKPPEPARLDFHGAVAACGDYPLLLRRLGLAIDVRIKLDPAIPTTGRLRLVVSDPPAVMTWVKEPRARPWTRFERLAGRFLPQPNDKGADLVEGSLRLENLDAFAVNQIDLDGSTMKTVDFAGNLRRLKAHLVNHPRSTIEDAAALPALRSGGFTIARDNQAAKVVDHLDTARAHEADHSANKPADLFAEDVTRGYRLDVLDTKHPGRWLSLHRRDGTYRVEPSGKPPVTLDIPSDEGYVKGTSASAVPGQADTDGMYLHEAMFGWEGWSLAAKRPGLAITTTGAEAIEPKNPTDVPLLTAFEPTPGTLPLLRYGRTYRFRARAVDLAGNSVPDKLVSPKHVTAAQTFRRFDPLPSPTVVPRRPFTEGESLMRMVLRSTLGVLPSAYVALPRITGLAGHTDPTSTGYTAHNDRHLAAPMSSQQFAELHGCFDPDLRVGATQAQLDTQFEIAAREAGSFMQPGPGVTVFNPDPGTTPTDLADPARQKGDPLQQGEYVLHDVAKVELPYLPDPLSHGVSFTTLPGDAGTTLQRWEIGTGWFDRKPFRIRIINGSGGSNYVQADRLLTVRLAQAELVTVRLSSFMTPGELELMGVWMLEGQAFRNAQFADARDGLHWMLTPNKALTFVHAVEKPLTAPEIKVPAVGVPGSGVRRNAGETLAVLAGLIANHAKSTGRLDVEAVWTEPVDDLARDEPSTLGGRAHVGDFLVRPSENNLRIGRDEVAPTPTIKQVHRLRHEFGDTKHRSVDYHAVATTRFREYFPPEITDDPELVTHKGPTLRLDIPSTRRPEPPEVLYVVPTWTWSQGATLKPPFGEKDKARFRTRSGGGLRVYLDRPWYSSGDDELLAVVLEDQPWLTFPLDLAAGMQAGAVPKALADEAAEQLFAGGLVKGAGRATSPAARLLESVQQAAMSDPAKVAQALGRITDESERALALHSAIDADPLLLADTAAAGLKPSAGKSLDALTAALASLVPLSGDPQKFVSRWGLDPIWGSAPVPDGPYIHQFPLRTAVGTELALSEAPGHTVTAVGHKPQFDPVRKLWFCDLQLDAGAAYFPFVRLALARYQPHSIPGHHLSKIVFPDFAQLVPRRTAAVTRLSTGMAIVSLRGPGAVTANAKYLEPFGGLAAQLGVSRFAVVQVERLPKGSKTDLGWVPAGEELRLNLTASGEGLASVIYQGQLPIPKNAAGEQLRLSLREYEVFLADGAVADHTIVRVVDDPSSALPDIAVSGVKYRLAYADHLPLEGPRRSGDVTSNP